MGVLSKNSLVILILFLSFVGCKDNDKPEPIKEVVYEDWSKIPNTEIYLSSRNVTALEGYDSFLFVQCLKSFYILNSDLQRVDGGGRSLSKEPFFDNRPKIGSDWTVINGDRGFEVFSNFDLIILMEIPSNTNRQIIYCRALQFHQLVYIIHNHHI